MPDRIRRLLTAADHLWAVSWRRYSIVTLVFFGLMAVQTWPHFAHFGNTILGGGADVPEGIRALRALHVHGHNPFTSGAPDATLAAPDGIPADRAINIANFLFTGAVWVIGVAFGFLLAFNVYNVVWFVLTGTATYVLFDRLGWGAAVAAFGAYVFTFNPNHLEKAYGAAPLTATAVLPILLLALLHKRREPTRASSLIVGALLLVAFYLNSYLGLFALWLIAAFLVTEVMLPPVGRSRFGVLRSYYFAALLFVLGMAPAAAAWAAQPGTVGALAATRSGSLPGGSANGHLYLLPGPRNPWLGHPMGSWLSTHLAWEQTMFFGYATMALAAGAIVLVLVRLRRGSLAREQGAFVVFAVLLLAMSLWASLPDTIDVAGLQVPTLQHFLRHVTTLYRVFARFGTLVGFALVLLACFTLASLPRRRMFAIVPVLALVAVAFELYTPQPKLVSVEGMATPVSIPQIARYQSGSPWLLDVSDPPAYVRAIKQLPPGIVANYPSPEGPDGRWEWKDLWYQTIHDHALWQVTSTATGDQDPNGTRMLASDLNRPIAGAVLASSGVRYVVVHRDRYRALKLSPPRQTCGMRLLGQYGAGRVAIYEVTAKADSGWVARGTGFDSIANPKLWPESTGLHWMGDVGRLNIFWPAAGRVVIDSYGVSLNKPRALTVTDSAGEVVATWPNVLTTETSFHFVLPVHSGLNSFWLRATPGAEIRGQGDGRSVTIAVSTFSVVKDGNDTRAAQPLPSCQKT